MIWNAGNFILMKAYIICGSNGRDNMKNNNKTHFDAFISYRHLEKDMIIAKKLQTLLESCKILDKTTGKKRCLHIFRDESELLTSENLGADIEAALKNSDFLIILYSKTTKESKWCMKELEYFRALHGNTNNHILPMLLEGEPENVFPHLLLVQQKQVIDSTGNLIEVREAIEPMAADIRSEQLHGMIRKLKQTGYLRLLAPILGVRFDDLYKRRQRVRNRRIALAAAALFIGLAAFGGYNSYMLRRLSEQNKRFLRSESKRITSYSQNEENDTTLALLLAQQACSYLPENELGESEALKVYRNNAIQKQIDQTRNYLNFQAAIHFNLSAIQIYRSYDHGAKLAVTDNEKTYLYDVYSGKLLFECPGTEVYFDEEARYCASSDAAEEMNVVTGYRTDTGEVTFLYQKERRSYAAMTLEVLIDEDTGIFYICDSEDSSVFAASVSAEFEITEYPEVPDKIRNRYFDIEDSSISVYLDTFVNNTLSSQYQFTKENRYNYLFSFEEEERWISLEQLGYIVEAAHIVEDLDLELFQCRKNPESGYVTVLYSLTDGQIYDEKDGICYYDSANGLIYNQSVSDIMIYAINDLYSSTAVSEPEPLLIQQLSRDNTLCLTVSGDDVGRLYGNGNLLSLSVTDMENRNLPLLKTKIYTSSMSQSYLCFADPDINHVFYLDSDGVFRLYDVRGQKTIISWRADDAGEVEAVSMNEDGSVLAVAYRKDAMSMIEIYAAKDGALLQTIDVSELLEARHSAYSEIMHMELVDEYLLVSCEESSAVLVSENGLYQIDNTLRYPLGNGNRSYPFARFLTSDHLLFFTQSDAGYEMGNNYNLYFVYDINSDQELDLFSSMVASFSYDAQTGLLVWQDFNSFTVSGSVHIAKRLKDGSFTEIGEFKSDRVDMSLRSQGSIQDGKYLLLENEEYTQVFDLETQTMVLEIKGTGFSIGNGLLIDTSGGSTSGNTYDYLMDYSQIQKIAASMLTTNGETRALTAAEKEHYFITDFQ